MNTALKQRNQIKIHKSINFTKNKSTDPILSTRKATSLFSTALSKEKHSMKGVSVINLKTILALFLQTENTHCDVCKHNLPKKKIFKNPASASTLVKVLKRKSLKHPYLQLFSIQFLSYLQQYYNLQCCLFMMMLPIKIDVFLNNGSY